MQSLALSIADTCSALSLSRSSVYKLINASRLRTLKIGTRTLVTMESIEALLKEAGHAQARGHD
ncbi:helix-turn-helix domain-containing protein [Erythrobacter sp. GH1-10]|uniref:helix-turn-helix domain-containing protein n=1 Tax=Erythrobacter sp. GH1-10 TaxID=3349334 RepID=UPI0038780475